MIIYNNFNREYFKPYATPDSPPPRKTVVVATNFELSRIWYFRRLAIATCALDLSRREIPNWIADVIFSYEGRILWPNGEEFRISDTAIDDVFGNDGSFRWISDFLKFGSLRAPRQKPQYRIIKRLRLIDLAFRIAHPNRMSAGLPITLAV